MERIGNGDVDLFSVNSDGSDRFNLTNGLAEDYDPAVSPDGTRIALDSYRDDPDNSIEEIYVMKLNGTGLVILTNNTADDYSPTWSPETARRSLPIRTQWRLRNLCHER